MSRHFMKGPSTRCSGLFHLGIEDSVGALIGRPAVCLRTAGRLSNACEMDAQLDSLPESSELPSETLSCMDVRRCGSNYPLFLDGDGVRRDLRIIRGIGPRLRGVHSRVCVVVHSVASWFAAYPPVTTWVYVPA